MNLAKTEILQIKQCSCENGELQKEKYCLLSITKDSNVFFNLENVFQSPTNKKKTSTSLYYSEMKTRNNFIQVKSSTIHVCIVSKQCLLASALWPLKRLGYDPESASRRYIIASRRFPDSDVLPLVRKWLMVWQEAMYIISYTYYISLNI